MGRNAEAFMDQISYWWPCFENMEDKIEYVDKMVASWTRLGTQMIESEKACKTVPKSESATGQHMKYSHDTCPKNDTWFAEGGRCGWAHACKDCKDSPIEPQSMTHKTFTTKTQAMIDKTLAMGRDIVAGIKGERMDESSPIHEHAPTECFRVFPEYFKQDNATQRTVLEKMREWLESEITRLDREKKGEQPVYVQNEAVLKFPTEAEVVAGALPAVCPSDMDSRAIAFGAKATYEFIRRKLQ